MVVRWHSDKTTGCGVASHARWARLITGFALIALLGGCGGGGSAGDTPSVADAPSATQPPTPNPAPTPAPTPPPPTDGPLFAASFPPAASRTEAAFIPIVGRLREGVAADSIIASTNDKKSVLSQTADGQWRGELPLAQGTNALKATVTSTEGIEQTFDLGRIERGVVLGFPNDLVVAGNRAYTRDRGRRSGLGLVEIDLATGIGSRVVLNPSIASPAQLIGDVDGGLLVRNARNTLALLDLANGTSRTLFEPFRETTSGFFNLVLDDSSDRLYARLDTQVVFADIDGARPLAFFTGIQLDTIVRGDFLGLDPFGQDLIYQAFSAFDSATSIANTPPLISINVKTGERTERAIDFQGAPVSAVAALGDSTGLALVDPLGRFFRLEGDTLTLISGLAAPNDQAAVTELALVNDRWLSLDSQRGNLFTVNPLDGSRETILSSANGSGPPSAGWHGLIFNPVRDELVGISFIGAQRIDPATGDRSSGLAIEFEPLSAGPNFIALPPLADGLSLSDDGNELVFARVTNVAMAPTDIVRLNLTTGVSATLATVNSQATGTLLPRFPTVITDAARQLAWFFDVDAARSLSRIDLITGTVTDLSLSVADRPLLSVLADTVNDRLLYATLANPPATIPLTDIGESRLDIIALNDDGQMPETLASILVSDATAVTDPRIQMALSPAGDRLYVPLPTTERIAVID